METYVQSPSPVPGEVSTRKPQALPLLPDLDCV